LSKKSPKIAALLAEHLGSDFHSPYYTGYFHCFNLGLYYEAHDVLEELWLGCKREADGDFYKGLIQFAGAYVHLRKERLRPASNLFQLALTNLGRYPARHHDLDVAAVRAICRKGIGDLAAGGYLVNPWTPEKAPKLALEEPIRP
jgi:predicted metal-dependent hydrolase